MFVFSNLAISVDGKIATKDRGSFPLGTAADRKLMIVLRKRSDAVMMGASTLRTYKKPLLIPGSRKQPVNVIVSSKLDGISPDWKFFTEPSTRKIIFVSSSTPQARIRRFSSVAEVIRLKSSRRHDAATQMIQALAKRGIRRLLVEGGGQLMWDFVEPNLVDEFYVTLTPRVLGGNKAPTLVDGIGFDPDSSLKLKLKSCRRLGDELYLVYRKTARRGR